MEEALAAVVREVALAAAVMVGVKVEAAKVEERAGAVMVARLRHCHRARQVAQVAAAAAAELRAAAAPATQVAAVKLAGATGVDRKMLRPPMMSRRTPSPPMMSRRTPSRLSLHQEETAAAAMKAWKGWNSWEAWVAWGAVARPAPETSSGQYQAEPQRRRRRARCCAGRRAVPCRRMALEADSPRSCGDTSDSSRAEHRNSRRSSTTRLAYCERARVLISAHRSAG